MPPSKYLLTPWEEWGEVDFLLTQGYAAYLENICSCGCGQWRPECQDPRTVGQYEVTDFICNAGAAIAAWQRDNKDADDGTLISVRFTGGSHDEAASVAAEIEAMKFRHGIA